MKNDLATAIVAAITGVLVAYFVSNMVISNFAKSTYSVKNVDSSVSTDLADPDKEVFNYKSLNPTVEVYVGNCTNVNMYGECADESSESEQQLEEGIIEDADENEESNNSSNSSSNSNSLRNQRNNQNGSSN